MFYKFFKWIEPTILGTDNKVSHRRVSVFYFMLLLTYMVIMSGNGSIFPEIAWIVVSGGSGLFSGLTIWQEMVNKKKNENNNEESTVTDIHITDTTVK